MTGHFTTLDKCERWAPIHGASEFMRVPYSYPTPINPGTEPVMPRPNSYAYRVYKLEHIDYSRGLAEYLEVAQ
jgi:hypothetical protein